MQLYIFAVSNNRCVFHMGARVDDKFVVMKLLIPLSLSAVGVCCCPQSAAAASPIASRGYAAFSTDSVAGATADVRTDTVGAKEYEYLDEFIITANKKVIQTDGTNVTYNVSEDTSSDGQSALDMLRKVPYVTVDGDDNIRIKGESGFKVLINGHENTAMSANLSKILKSMPASGIEKVEVINEPGAKYDAEGVAGILNIVMNTKTKDDAYNVGLQLDYSLRQAAATATGRVKKGQFAADATVTYANGGDITLRDKSSNHSEITYLDSDTYHRMVEDIRQTVMFDYISVGANLSYEVDRKNLLTANFFYNDISAKCRDITSTAGMYDINGRQVYGYSTDYHAKMTYSTLSAGANYEHLFKEDGSHKLAAAYLYNYGRNLASIGYMNYAYQNYNPDYDYSSSDNWLFDHEHTFQIDYSNSFGGSRHALESGAKFVLRRNDAKGKRTAGENSETAAQVDYSDVVQKQDIYALYATYAFKLSSFQAKAGVRYEHTSMGMDYKSGNTPDFMKNLDDVVPNASLTWIFGPASNLRLAYQMRITRPDLASVNPYRMIINQTMASQGNPDLGCARANKVSLGYTNFGRIFGGTVTLEYSQTDDAIASAMINEGQMVIDTKLNNGRIKILGLSAFLNANITSGMNLSVSGNVSYNDYRSQVNKNSGWMGNFNVNYGAMLPASIRFNAYGGLGTKNYTFTGYYSGYHYYGLGFSRSFLKNDALKIGINASNCFEGHLVFESRNQSNNVITRTRAIKSNWSVGVSISWNIGGLTQGARKASIIIDNDDVARQKASTGGVGG